MNKYIYFLLSFSIIVCFGQSLYAQGCSDAGFCTLNSFKPAADSTLVFKNQCKIGASFGGADENITVLGNYLEYNRQLSHSWSLDAKITSLSQSGNEISTFGLSDIYLNANVHLTQSIKGTFGVKLPLTDGNSKKDNLPLPLDYQSSLGTIDLILGLGYSIKNVHVVVALQQPLTQNKNEFIAEVYPLQIPLSRFQSTNQFKRSGDILLRVSYPIAAGNKWTFTPSLLPIYHLSEDKFTNITGQEFAIVGSDGLTLNGNLYIDYLINQNSAFQLNLATPFIVRDVRPDGLTRSFVANLEYQYKF